MKKLMIIALLGLAGCAGKPQIVDISSEWVVVESSEWVVGGGSDAETLAKAHEGCNVYGGPPKTAVPLSDRCFDYNFLYCTHKEAVFFCKANVTR